MARGNLLKSLVGQIMALLLAISPNPQNMNPSFVYIIQVVHLSHGRTKEDMLSVSVQAQTYMPNQQILMERLSGKAMVLSYAMRQPNRKSIILFKAIQTVRLSHGKMRGIYLIQFIGLIYTPRKSISLVKLFGMTMVLLYVMRIISNFPLKFVVMDMEEQ